MKTRPTSAPVGAPAFRVAVVAFAWTEEQAQRIKTQVQHMFTAGATEVTIEPNTPPASVPELTAPKGAAAQPADSETVPARRVSRFVDALAESGVPASKIVPALGALLPPAASAAAEAPAIVRPFAVGDTVRDLHVADRIVTVAEVDDAGFKMSDGNSCPWASAANCYEKVSPAAAGPTSTSAKTGADELKKKPAPKTRPHKPGAPKDKATLNPAKVRQPRTRGKLIGAHTPKPHRN